MADEMIINPTPDQIRTDLDPQGDRAYRWTFTGTITVTDVWVADGFDLTQEKLKDLIEEGLSGVLGYARPDEYEATAQITATPDPKAIRREQGYQD